MMKKMKAGWTRCLFLTFCSLLLPVSNLRAQTKPVNTDPRLAKNNLALFQQEIAPAQEPSNETSADPNDGGDQDRVNDLTWDDEVLPDWLEELGLEEEDSSEGEDQPSNAEQAQQGIFVNPFGSSSAPLRMRPTLTGDWGGVRTDLLKRGILYRGRITQYAFGVGGGINEPIPPIFRAQGVAPGDVFRYTGTSRHDLIVETEKFAGPKAGKLLLTAENIFGTFGNVSLRTGAFAPIFGAFVPSDPAAQGVPRVTNIFYLQPLSKNLIVGVGKLRLPGVADQDVFAGGDGTDEFVNQTFAVNPMFISILPISTFAVTTVMPQEWGNISYAVMDPQERSTDFFEMGDLFSQGVILQSQLKVNTNFFGKPGDHHFGAIFKKADLLDISVTPTQPPYPTYPYPDARPGLATKSNTWAIYYGFDQYLQVFGEDARGNRKGWGLFGRGGIADGGDGNPNFIGWHASLGVGGQSPLIGRRSSGDQFGFGYSFVGASNQWGPQSLVFITPRDYQALEAFYRIQLTPAISVTPDIQWIQGMMGGLTQKDNSLLFGMRMNIHL